MRVRAVSQVIWVVVYESKGSVTGDLGGGFMRVGAVSQVIWVVVYESKGS